MVPVPLTEKQQGWVTLARSMIAFRPPMTAGSPSVMINFKPAVRQGDSLQNGGYRDTRDKDKRFNGACPFNYPIKLNNGRGWAYHGVQQSIENWEKLFNDKKIKGFFEKVGTMFN